MSKAIEAQKRQFSDTIYSRFSDIPDELIVNGFVAERAIEVILSKCRGYAKQLVQDEVTAKLTILINLLSLKKNVQVLDYGGGLGQIYFAVAKHLIFPDSIVWNVLDLEEMIRIAKDKMSGQPRLNFYTDINKIEQADIVFFRQSLQVLEYPINVLEHIVQSYDPKVIFMSGVPAGENETYLSLVLAEENKGSPCWIFNEDQLLTSVRSLGHTLIDRITEGITINLSNFEDIRYHLDSERKNHVKGYVFTKADTGEVL